MEVPVFDPRSAKKLWWDENKEFVQKATEQNAIDRAAKRKTCFDPLPKNVRLIYLKKKIMVEEKFKKMSLQSNYWRTVLVPVGCLVTKYIVTKEEKYMIFQFSGLSPLDKFSREIARKLTLERLESNPLAVTGSIDSTPFELKWAITEYLAGFNPTNPKIYNYPLINPKTQPGKNVFDAAVEWMNDKTYEMSKKQTSKEIEKEQMVFTGVPLH
jgi:hypothetical protein